MVASSALTKDSLGYWRINKASLPQIAHMFQDIFPVLVIGARVERKFSKSGRMASWTLTYLYHWTISETMVVKDMLAYHGNK